MNKYIGKVIDNNSADKDGSCQIYCEPLHHGFQPSQYPWMKQEREWTSNIPEINDLVWCRFDDEDFYKKGYYGSKLTLKEYHTHGESIGSITSAYPDVKYIKLANGNAIAMSSNTDTPEITIYHKEGSEIFMNKTGEVHIKGSSGTLEKSALGETLKGLLESILDEIILITVGTPSGGSTTPVNAGQFTTIKGQLSTMLSPKVKNN